AQAEHTGIEVDVAGRVAGDAGDVMDAFEAHGGDLFRSPRMSSVDGSLSFRDTCRVKQSNCTCKYKPPPQRLILPGSPSPHTSLPRGGACSGSTAPSSTSSTQLFRRRTTS